MTTAPSLPTRRYRQRYWAHLPARTEIETAQRLRHRVLTEPYRALIPPDGCTAGRHADEWDDVCDRLVATDEVSGDVVGTYRLLPPERALALGRTYGEDAFGLRPHAGLRQTTVEARRGWVHAEHRSGGVLTAMWAGIPRYVFERGHSHLAGCASIPLADGGATTAGVWNRVPADHLVPASLQVRTARSTRRPCRLPAG